MKILTKMLIKQFILHSRLIMALMFVIIAYSVDAQPTNPTNPTPIDGGLGLLVAGGVGLAYRKYKQNKQQSSDDTQADDLKE